MGRFHFIASLALLAVPFLSANATSRGAEALRSKPSCDLPARFIEAKSKQGKVVWAFDRIGSSPLSSVCTSVNSNFEVWIWSGSFSTLSNSFVYPVSITEPKPGEEFDLRLDHLDVREMPTKSQLKKTSVSGWFLAPEADAMKARAR